MAYWIVTYSKYGIVLFLMLFARIWDSFNDPIMGYIMDRVNLKNGKMRPYLLYAPIPVAILTVLLFQAPNISMTGLMVYAAVTYVLWDMAYTVCDVPFWGLPNALTSSSARMIFAFLPPPMRNMRSTAGLKNRIPIMRRPSLSSSYIM